MLSGHARSRFRTEMKNKRRSFVNDKTLLLFAGTWNVNGHTPQSTIDISPWIQPQSLSSSQPVDLYMLGLQEVQTLSGVDAFRTDNTRGLAWRNVIQKCLGSDYEIVAERQLVGIVVLVFLRQNHVPYLSNIQLSHVATGFFNTIGNKGGVAARFTLYDRTIACVACHLTAHTSNVERRNQDFTDVVRKAVFLPGDNQPYLDQPMSTSWDISKSDEQSISNLTRSSTVPMRLETPSNPTFPSGFPAVAAGTASWLGSVATVAASTLYDISSGANSAILNDPNAINVLDHDVVFWLGDLNYRLDASCEHVLGWLESENWDALYKADQLQKQMKICPAFSGFREGPLRFPPSYKLERFSNEYACDETGEFKRVPSYTDRILWRIGTADDDVKGDPDIRLKAYTSASTVLSSDHRPVYALFNMTFGVEDMHRRKNVEARVIKGLDEEEPFHRPVLQLSSSSVDFGDVFFENACERQVSIRNIGDVKGAFSVSIPTDIPKWLELKTPDSKWVEVFPGKSAVLRVRVLITADDGMAEYICDNRCVLETAISIETDPGHFHESIRVTGRYVATTLGLSLESLSMLEDPVLSLRQKGKVENPVFGGIGSRDYDNEMRCGPGRVPLPVPKEIWLLFDSLLRVNEESGSLALDESPSLFLGGPDEAQIQRVLAFIDRAHCIPEELSLNAVAMCLIRVFEKMHEPIIPRFAYRRAIEAGHAEDADAVKTVIGLLPPINANVFWYVVGFLCQVGAIQRRESRGHAMVSVFAKVMLRSSRSERTSRDEKSRTAFLQTAIRHQLVLLQSSETPCSITIDLCNPTTHPRRLQEPVKRLSTR